MILIDARAKANLTQVELAERSGISQTQYSMIERGAAMPYATTRASIEKVLGCRVDWVQTRLSGNISQGFTENESPEDLIIKSINAFIKSANPKDRLDRFAFLKEFIKKYEQNLTKK